VQPFALAGRIPFLESYRGPHQFSLDETFNHKIWLIGQSTDMEYMV